MAEDYPLFIPAAQSSGRLPVTAPYDGSEIGSAAIADRAAIAQALTTAHALHRDRNQWLSGGERIAILNRAAEIMQSRFEYLALEAAREGGKPLTDSRVEVTRAIDGVRNCAELLRNQSGQEIPMDINPASAHHIAFTRHEPIGIVVAVSAFNHPLNLIVHQVAPAVAAACPVIVKPAEATPLSCMRFVSILHEAGLPPEWCQACVVDDHAVAEQLVTDPRTAFFSFIGSAKVGWMLRAKLAPGTRCALEHGGAAPVIIAEDADLDTCLPALAKAGFYHAGQVCVSVQRVFAPAALAEPLAQRLAALAKAMKIGDPTAEQTEIGPLIRPREVHRIHDWVQQAIGGGGQQICGGEPLSNNCYPATVLLDPPDSALVSRNEIFGPIICIYPYQDLDAAIARANSLPYAFQAAVFTKNIDTALHAYKHLDAAAVMVNQHTAFRVDWMPFAGLKQSGYGTGGIRYTYEDMTIQKLAVIHSPAL